MKKILILGLSCILLTGCGNKEEEFIDESAIMSCEYDYYYIFSKEIITYNENGEATGIVLVEKTDWEEIEYDDKDGVYDSYLILSEYYNTIEGLTFSVSKDNYIITVEYEFDFNIIEEEKFEGFGRIFEYADIDIDKEITKEKYLNSSYTCTIEEV